MPRLYPNAPKTLNSRVPAHFNSPLSGFRVQLVSFNLFGLYFVCPSLSFCFQVFVHCLASLMPYYFVLLVGDNSIFQVSYGVDSLFLAPFNTDLISIPIQFIIFPTYAYMSSCGTVSETYIAFSETVLTRLSRCVHAHSRACMHSNVANFARISRLMVKQWEKLSNPKNRKNWKFQHSTTEKKVCST